MMESKVLCYADFAIRDKRETLITYYKVFSLSLQARKVYARGYISGGNYFCVAGATSRSPLTNEGDTFSG